MLLVPGGQPFRIVLLAGLQAGLPPLRWAIVGGRPGRMRGSGLDPAADAIGLLASAAARRERIAALVGDQPTDTLLADLAPAFAALLADLTDRQREVGRLLLIDGLRRSEIAARLGISRPTVSVMVDRARLNELEGLARGLDRILASALE
jgi:DNA-directed RNA polymerase specialized sigma24 family protein